MAQLAFLRPIEKFKYPKILHNFLKPAFVQLYIMMFSIQRSIHQLNQMYQIVTK